MRLTCNGQSQVHLGYQDDDSSRSLPDDGIQEEHLRKDWNGKSIRCNEIKSPCVVHHPEIVFRILILIAFYSYGNVNLSAFTNIKLVIIIPFEVEWCES